MWKSSMRFDFVNIYSSYVATSTKELHYTKELQGLLISQNIGHTNF